MNTVLESIKNRIVHSNPWPHYEIHNIFDENVCKWIADFNYPSNKEIFERKVNWYLPSNRRTVAAVGVREFLKEAEQLYNAAKEHDWHKKTHTCEFIFGADFLSKYPQAYNIAQMFLDPEVIDNIESIENVSLKKSFLRIMLIKDVQGYKISVHPDSERKLFTMQCFFRVNNSEDLGTQICDVDGNILKRTIYKENCGTFFFPRQVQTETHIPTLHAFVDTPIADYRISIMVNYCTKEEVKKDRTGMKLGYFLPVSR
jgi:hypothetical protein